METSETKIYLRRKNVSLGNLLISIAFFVYIVHKLITRNLLDYEGKSMFNNEFGRWVMLAVALTYLAIIIKNIQNYLRRNHPKKAGLILNKEGISDEETEAKALGIIRWEDILAVRSESGFMGDLLIIKVKNPEEYLDRIQNQFKLKQTFRKYNAKYQTPVVIKTYHLEKTSQELRDLIKSKIKSVNVLD